MPPRVRAKIPPPKPQARVSEPEVAGEKVVLAILPSWRVAKFRMPRVKHAMAIREAAMVEAGIDLAALPSADKQDEKSEAARARALVMINEAMERVALRELLIGISDRPVEVIYREDFPGEPALRAKYEAEAQAEVAKASEEGRDVDSKLLEIDRLVALEVSKAVDDSATAKDATIHPLTDLDWDREAGVLGELSNSYEGTPEAADWIAVHTFATRLLSGMRALGVGDSPKAPPRPIRSSAGFVT